jgi:hypothetical protein
MKKVRIRYIGSTINGLRRIVTLEEADIGYIEAKRYLAGLRNRELAEMPEKPINGRIATGEAE